MYLILKQSSLQRCQNLEITDLIIVVYLVNTHTYM